MKVLLGLLCCLVFFFGCAQKEKKTTFAGAQLEDVLKQKPKVASDIVSLMKKCAMECVSPDNMIAKDLADGYEILFSIANATKPMQQFDRDQKARFLEAQKKVRAAFLKILETKENRNTLETAYRELLNPPYGAYLDPELERTMNNAIARLKAKPATRATGFYLQAISIPPVGENILSIIEAYKQCLTVSQFQDKDCLSQYEDVVHFYERPRCQSEAFSPSLQFFEAEKERNSIYKHAYPLRAKTFYTVDKPILAGKDLLEATVELVGIGQWEIWFSLKTFSSEKFQALTERGTKEKGLNLLMVNNKKALASALINQKITEGQFRMVFNDEKSALSAFHQVCKKSTPEKIPESLQIK
jgi:hypothetical protein